MLFLVHAIVEWDIGEMKYKRSLKIKINQFVHSCNKLRFFFGK